MTTIQCGYDAAHLDQMYMEAKANMLYFIHAGDIINATKWKQAAIDCAVTLYAINKGHEI